MTNSHDDFDLPDLPTDAIEPLQVEIVVTHAQIAERARRLWQRGSTDSLANWLRAERDVAWIATRAAELHRGGQYALTETWRRAEAEFDELTTA